jgi:hypothetical protein
MRRQIARWLHSRKLEAGRRRAQRMRADLEQRGVPEALARAISDRLEPRAAALDPSAYQAVLDAACIGARRRRRRCDARDPEAGPDFAVELQKLDEGLRLLSTYLRASATALAATRVRDSSTELR